MKRIIFSNWLLCTILTLLILGGMLQEFYPMELLEYKAYDFLTGIRQRENNSPVVIVKIDNKSINDIGGWPWPRSYIADMLRRLSRYGPKTLGVYLWYPYKDINPGLKEIKTVRELLRKDPSLGKRKSRYKIDEILAKAEKQLDHDSNLTATVNYAANLVMPLRFTLGMPEREDASGMSGLLTRNSLVLNGSVTSPATQPHRTGSFLKNSIDETISACTVTTTFSQAAIKAGALGHINQIADRDGIVRKVPLFISYQGRYFPSLALQVAAKYVAGTIGDLKPGDAGISLKTLEIPTDRQYRMLIDVKRKDTQLNSFSFSDVLNDKVPQDAFKDKIVLLGITDRWLVPAYKTTTHKVVSGVEIDASVIENILNRKHFSRPSWAYVLEIAVILHFGLLLVLVIPRVNPRGGVLILGVFLITWIGFAVGLFMVFGYWLKVIASIFLAVIGYCLAGFKRFAAEKRYESTELNKMLGLSFQEKGMLELAFEKFLKCPVKNNSARDLLYDLALDFERKRMFKKALDVYNHILKAGKFKDINERIATLKNIEGTAIFTPGSPKHEATLLLNDAATKPTVGRYEILTGLGQGAMGTVYLGRDPKINREVAIKTLKYGDVDADQLAKIKTRFFREAEAAGKLSHTNIVTIYDVGEEHDMAYMAMEFLKGKDLSQYCRKDSLLHVKKTLKVVASVAEALDYAHRNGVVHRDIKPENIILLENHQVKVADFGIARVMSASKTRTGVILGTPNYMSPEQVAGEKVDGRSDLFSLGVVLYELLAGEKPFKGDNLSNLICTIANVSYLSLSEAAPDIPCCCGIIIDKLLVKNVKQRVQSADKVVELVKQCLKAIE